MLLVDSEIQICISLKFILWGGVGPIDFSVLLETYKGEITVTGIMGLCQARIREYLILLLLERPLFTHGMLIIGWRCSIPEQCLQGH